MLLSSSAVARKIWEPNSEITKISYRCYDKVIPVSTAEAVVSRQRKTSLMEENQRRIKNNDR